MDCCKPDCDCESVRLKDGETCECKKNLQPASSCPNYLWLLVVVGVLLFSGKK